MAIKPQRADTAVVLGVLRGLTVNVPSRESPLLDRVFALECSIRGGTATRVVADELRAARREAEWRISDEWELDVPHAAELGQAISTAAASGSDPPQDWVEKLTTTVERLSLRRTKFGLDSDPLLLAAVIRGLGAADQKLPAKLVEAARALLERRLPTAAAAEIAEALSRHQEHDALAKDFAAAAFASSASLDARSASARWWLAERWIQVRGCPLPKDPEQIRQARLIVLSTPIEDDARARAMALEAVGRSVDRLVVDTPDNLEAASTSLRRRLLTEIYFWRAVVVSGAALLVMFNIDIIVGQIDTLTGVAKPTSLVFQLIFGLNCAVIAFSLVSLAVALAKLHRGLDMPKLERAAEIFIPLFAGLAGAILHQG
jgi:hypothetical protein